MDIENFSTSICTTREQSERLLSFGLRPETADMTWHYTNSRTTALEWDLKPFAPTLRGGYWTPERIAKLKGPLHRHPDGTLMTGEEVFDCIWGKDLPAWSIGRLLEVLGVSIKELYQPHTYNLSVRYGAHYWSVHLHKLGKGGLFTTSNEDLFEAVIEMVQIFLDSEFYSLFLAKVEESNNE